jgi:Zn-dependent protease with chaperone function
MMVVHRAHRAAYHFGIPEIDSSRQGHRCIGAERGGRSNESSDVARVLHCVENENPQGLATRQRLELSKRDCGDREDTLRRLCFSRRAELLLAHGGIVDTSSRDGFAQLQSARRVVELRRGEDTANLQRRIQKLLDGTNSFGNEERLLFPGFSPSQITCESQKSQEDMELADWNRNCLLLPRAIYRENSFMKRIFAPLALAASLSACGISQQQEVQMGQEYSQQINAQLPIVSDPEVNRYVNLLGDQIASHTSRADLDWHFYVVDSKEVNAFAVPGGYVYVNRGLIERTSSMDELAGVLGHEIGHVVLRHSIKQMEQQQGAQVGVTLACVLTGICNNQAAGALINVGGTAVFARFSRQDETEADQQGVINTIRAGISPQGMPTMFEKLLQERKTQPSAVAGWFATHPLEEDRIAAVRAQIASYPASQLRGLQTNSSNYTSFVARVRSLPPSRQ